MEFKFHNVNNAFAELVSGIHSGQIPTDRLPSRNGEVLKISEPVTITYENPRQRVLFNQARDCNPFFHLYEALWMLAGKNGVDPVAYYASNMRNYSDNGKTLHGAYGYRWRKWFGYDQLDWIADELKHNPSSRRVVLSMWNPYDIGGEPSNDFYIATHGGKDIPCNTHAYFSVRDSSHGLVWGPKAPLDKVQGEPIGSRYLDMTVCNRSNDLVWGALGANVVHFSFLQEYLAARIGVEVGKYHQFTNNLHVYTDNWKPEEWLEGKFENYGEIADVCPHHVGVPKFDFELSEFVQRHSEDSLSKEYKNPFLNNVAQPMCVAFHHHKRRDYNSALEVIERVEASDWRLVGKRWLLKRMRMYHRKHGRMVQ